MLELLVRVAVAANAATGVEEAAQIAVDAVCELTGWPVGHLYLLSRDHHDVLMPTRVWHLADPERAAP